MHSYSTCTLVWLGLYCSCINFQIAVDSCQSHQVQNRHWHGDTRMLNLSIQVFVCWPGEHPSPLPSQSPGRRGRTGWSGVVRATHLAHCCAPAAVTGHRAAHRAFPDSSVHKICVLCYSLPHFLTFLFTTLVPSFLHLSLPSTNPSLNAFFSFSQFCSFYTQIWDFDTTA